MAAPPPTAEGGAGEFRLDVDAAEAAIAALEAVKRDIKVARDDAARLAQSTPATAHDVVSLEAFACFQQIVSNVSNAEHRTAETLGGTPQA